MRNVIMCSECKKCDGDRCNYFDNDSDRESTIACILFEPKNLTFFDHIRSSPEVMAEKLVCLVADSGYNGAPNFYWKSTVVDAAWKTKPEAVAATLAKLKEVYDE